MPDQYRLFISVRKSARCTIDEASAPQLLQEAGTAPVCIMPHTSHTQRKAAIFCFWVSNFTAACTVASSLVTTTLLVFVLCAIMGSLLKVLLSNTRMYKISLT